MDLNTSRRASARESLDTSEHRRVSTLQCRYLVYNRHLRHLPDNCSCASVYYYFPLSFVALRNDVTPVLPSIYFSYSEKLNFFQIFRFMRRCPLVVTLTLCKYKSTLNVCIQTLTSIPETFVNKDAITAQKHHYSVSKTLESLLQSLLFRGSLF